MNKYIKTDLDNAAIQMKAAIMNALHDIDTGEEEKKIELGPYISANLLHECLEEAKWVIDDWESNGFQVDFWWYVHSPSGKEAMVKGCLYLGQKYEILLWKRTF